MLLIYIFKNIYHRFTQFQAFDWLLVSTKTRLFLHKQDAMKIYFSL